MLDFANNCFRRKSFADYSKKQSNRAFRGEFLIKVSVAQKSLSVVGKLAVVALLFAAFVGGLGAVLFMALRSPEVQVPEIVGKNYGAGEQELALLDLKIRERTKRFSQEPPNTILEQTPRAGERVKAGQTVSVIVARAEQEGDEKPAEVKKETTEDKPKDVDEPSEVDKARQKRKAANKNTSANKNANANGNSNAATNANANANSTSGGNANASGGNSNTRGNANAGAANSSNRPTAAPGAAANRQTTPANNRPAATGANGNRRPQ